MLKKITLDNYKTYINPTEIDFGATKYEFLEDENVGSNKILKGALFVGENASGKTQILKAIAFLLDLLFSNNELDFIQNKSFYTDKKTYSIKYLFVIEDTEIEYEIEFDFNAILREKLTLDNKLIINRSGKSAQFEHVNRKEYDDLPDKLPFLRMVYFDTRFYDDEILNRWFDFMKESVYVNCYDRTVVSYNSKNKLLVHDYLDANGEKDINDFFKEINYKQEIKYDVDTGNKAGFYAKSGNNMKFVSFKKQGTDVYVPEPFESTGNLTLIELWPAFMHATRHNCMLIVDEFSSGFHNELEESLIRYFNHYAKDSQLFFTSHSTNVIDNNILRPDQIYTVSFKGLRGSVLERFSEKMPRRAQNIEKMYLNGIFGGMPRYKKFFRHED